MEKLERAIEIWQGVCENLNNRERAQLALGPDCWYPAGPEIAVKVLAAEEIMCRLQEALENKNIQDVDTLVVEILEGVHRLQQ